MDELKPCPFCGSREIRIGYQKETGIPSGDDGFRVVIECKDTHNCGANIQRWALKQTWAHESIIRAWNRREGGE